MNVLHFLRMETIMDLWSHFASQEANIVTLNAHIREMIKCVKYMFLKGLCLA